ncbi:MAG: type 1 glutamine amidotransferase [Pseudomonadota bacterium]
MKPVAIFRHVGHEGAGYLDDFLDRHGIPRVLIAIDADEPVPIDPAQFSGLVFMGGPMSVNDDLPWIAEELALIRRAVSEGVPVLGHCLGGQLIAKALGGTVGLNRVREVGWWPTRTTQTAEARAWLGDLSEFPAFHWHGETFSLPEGATCLLESDHCRHQAFVLGPHLALQCHVEMTAPTIAEWCRVGADYITGSDSPGVQPIAGILAETPAKLPAMRVAADRLYGRWLAGLTG